MNIPYWDLVQKVAGEEGVTPALLAACMMTESNGLATAERYEPHLGVSSLGLMQVLTTTAPEVGIDPARLIEPEMGLRAGARYLRKQMDRFGTWPGVAAYNCGPGNVDKAVDKSIATHRNTGIDTEDLSEWETLQRFLLLTSASRSVLRHVRKVQAWYVVIVTNGATPIPGSEV